MYFISLTFWWKQILYFLFHHISLMTLLSLCRFRKKQLWCHITAETHECISKYIPAIYRHIIHLWAFLLFILLCVYLSKYINTWLEITRYITEYFYTVVLLLSVRLQLFMLQRVEIWSYKSWKYTEEWWIRSNQTELNISCSNWLKHDVKEKPRLSFKSIIINMMKVYLRLCRWAGSSEGRKHS